MKSGRQEEGQALVVVVGLAAVLIVLVTAAMLPNATTALAGFVLPSAGFAEKRGSMINLKGRQQRLNRAINPPGNARADC